MKSLFTLKDLSLKGRASALHYRTLMGRIYFAMLLFFVLAAGMLWLMAFPMASFTEAMMSEDEALMNGLMGMMRPGEIAIILVSIFVSLYLFVLMIGAMVMRLHDWGRSGWWLILIFIIPSLFDAWLMTVSAVGWFTVATSMFFLYKSGDFGKNKFGYDDAPKDGWPVSWLIVSFIPVIFIVAEVLVTLWFSQIG